jgi:flagellar hook-length control protein FliK
MPTPSFDITATFRPEPQNAGNSNAARSDRASDNAFADILRAQNDERAVAPADQRDENAPRDDASNSSHDKAPRQTKENEPAAKPAPRDHVKSETPETVSDVPSGESQAKPKAKKESSSEGEKKTAAPTAENTSDAPVETAPQDVAALQLTVAAAAVAAPVVPVVAQAGEIAVVAAAPAAGTTAPVAPTPNTAPVPVPDAAKPAGAEAPTPAAPTAPAAAAPVVPDDAANAPTATPEFDQLVAAALRSAKPKETSKAPVTDAATPAKPSAPAAAPKAAAAPTPVPNTNPIVTADAATTSATPAPVAATAIADAVSTQASDDDSALASVAAVVTRPAMPRQAEPRANAPAPTDVNLLPEPEMPELEAAPAPAPRSGQGMLTAATGLAAQVKAQELQSAPQPGAEKQTTLSVDSIVADRAGAKSATPDIAAKTENDAPAATSARTADAPAPAPAHDGNVRGTSFADSLSAARGTRATANPLVAQVAVHVAKAVSEGNDRITIKLSPADLGRIDVRLDIGTDGRIQAVFAADKPGTVEMLQRDARELERSLQDAGLRADSGSLSFNLRGEQQQQRDNDAAGFAGGTSPDNAGAALSELPAAATQIYTNSAAGNGRLDIHV